VSGVITLRLDGDLYYLDDESDPWEAARHGDGALVFYFGAYGGLRVLVYRSSGYQGVEDCLEAAAATMKDAGKTGLFTDASAVAGLVSEAEEEGYEGDDAYEQATADLTYTEAGYLTSYEWSVSDIHPGDAVYGAGVAKALETRPYLADNDEWPDIEKTLATSGASEARQKRAMDAVEADEG